MHRKHSICNKRRIHNVQHSLKSGKRQTQVLHRPWTPSGRSPNKNNNNYGILKGQNENRTVTTLLSLTSGGVVWLTPNIFRPKKRPSPFLGTKPSIGLEGVLARAVTLSCPTRGPKSTTLVTVGGTCSGPKRVGGGGPRYNRRHKLVYCRAGHADKCLIRSGIVRPRCFSAGLLCEETWTSYPARPQQQQRQQGKPKSTARTSEKRSMSWYMAKPSTPTNDRCTGEAVPGVVVKINLQLPSTKGLEAAFGTPPSLSRASTALSTSSRFSWVTSLLRRGVHVHMPMFVDGRRWVSSRYIGLSWDFPVEGMW